MAESNTALQYEHPLEMKHENKSSISGLLDVLNKHVVAFVVAFVVTVIAVLVWTVMSPLKYSTTTQLFATYNDTSQDSDSIAQNSGSSYIMAQIKSYPTLVATQSVLQPVIDELHLDMTSEELADTISVMNPTNTAFVNITVTSGDPKQSANIANAIAASLSNVVGNSLYSNNTGSAVKLTVVQPAPVPTSASSPKWALNIAVGIIGGLIAGLLVALLRDLFTTKIQDENDVADYIDAPVIGRIIKDDMLAANTPVVIGEPASPLAEDFRRIRTNLSFSTPTDGTDCRLIVVTSAGASEGKTTTSVNIAAALAEDGARVLLIDADLRHPLVAKKLDIDGSAGLTHVLSGQASVKDVIQRYWKPNLHVMPAGPKPPNASTLLNSPVMHTLLTNALLQYDYVLIDTAPMVVANDAVIFVREGGSLEMVCRRDQTLKRNLRDISKELDNLEIPVAGIIVNCVKENKKALEKSNYYYYYNDNSSQNKNKQ